MDDWLAGVERILIAGATGGSWANDLPDRVVLHTTEGSTLEGAVATYRRTKGVPTFTVDLAQRRAAQHLSMNASATALANVAGGVETNRVGRCIQIEIVGYSVDSPDRSEAELAWLGAFLRRIRDEGGVDFQMFSPPMLPYPESYGRSSVRMGFAEWQNFNGVCGHQHVPENDHGDPGALNMAVVFNSDGDEQLTPEEHKALDEIHRAVMTPSSTLANGQKVGLEWAMVYALAAVQRIEAKVNAMQSAAPAPGGTLSDADVQRIAKAVIAEIAS